MAHMAPQTPGPYHHRHQGEGWLLARDLLVDLELTPLLRDPSAAPTLLGLVRAKRLVERTLEELLSDAGLLAVRRGYWEVGGWVGGGVQ